MENKTPKNNQKTVYCNCNTFVKRGECKHAPIGDLGRVEKECISDGKNYLLPPNDKNCALKCRFCGNYWNTLNAPTCSQLSSSGMEWEKEFDYKFHGIKKLTYDGKVAEKIVFEQLKSFISKALSEAREERDNEWTDMLKKAHPSVIAQLQGEIALRKLTKEK